MNATPTLLSRLKSNYSCNVHARSWKLKCYDENINLVQCKLKMYEKIECLRK